ncbi:MAG: type II secretion system F family protein [Deltaproteobacteria bacterium]|nr:type II secretion system F family protein [Deltaproteobacteria bacterium]
MTLALAVVICFTVVITIQAALAVQRARAAHRSAWFAARILDQGADPLAAESALRKRLAKSVALQRLLGGWPLALRLALLLTQTGLDLTVAGFLARLALLFATGLSFAAALGQPFEAALGAGLLAGLVLVAYVVFCRARRQQAFAAALPAALEMLTLFLRAGRSLPQAVAATAEELLPPIADELRSVAEEYRLGRSIEDALRGLVSRYPANLGLRSFVMAAAVLGQTGGNIVEAIDGVRKALQAEAGYALRLSALTGESRMSGVLLGALPGAFLGLSAVLNPSYFALLFAHRLGNLLLLLCVTLWLAGVAWIRILLRARPL